MTATEFDRAARSLLARVKRQRCAPSVFAFPHVRITERAFPPCSEVEIGKARQFIESVDDPAVRTLLNLACMSVLEECSYTRKDGQYLRWDHRSGRSQAKTDMGHIPTFQQSLAKRLDEVLQDFAVLKDWYRGGHPELVTGSSLDVLRSIPTGRFDMVITSPPYANRYDYTRTYALELAWLGYDRQDFAELRQQMLSATVENKTKLGWLNEVYSDDCSLVSHASRMYEASAVHEVLAILRDHIDELSNKNVIRLIEGYFFEMAVIIAELGRIVRPGGVAIMVNDNVQYHGEEVPVDFILSTTPNSLDSLVLTFGRCLGGRGIPASRWQGSVDAKFGSVSTSGYGPVTDPGDALYKSRLLSELVRQRVDVALRKAVEDFGTELDFEPLENLMISEAAWQYAAAAEIEPKLVFAHPVLLQSLPKTSQYYRGMTLLSQKQVQQLARVGVGLGGRVAQQDGPD